MSGKLDIVGVMSNGECRNGDEGPQTPQPQLQNKPPPLRTLRFGDRTISYDHEGGEGDDDENVNVLVGAKDNIIAEGEGDTEGRRDCFPYSQFLLSSLCAQCSFVLKAQTLTTLLALFT